MNLHNALCNIAVSMPDEHHVIGKRIEALEGSMLLTRQLLYTAMSRARELCIVVGTRSAVARAVRNDREERRRTGLVERLVALRDGRGLFAERDRDNALEAVKELQVRVAFIGHPKEPWNEHGPDWSYEIALAERAIHGIPVPQDVLDFRKIRDTGPPITAAARIEALKQLCIKLGHPEKPARFINNEHRQAYTDASNEWFRWAESRLTPTKQPPVCKVCKGAGNVMKYRPNGSEFPVACPACRAEPLNAAHPTTCGCPLCETTVPAEQDEVAEDVKGEPDGEAK